MQNNTKQYVPELIFVRDGNVPSSKVFTLKLSNYSVVSYLILESQNNIFPEELSIQFKDFVGNIVNLKAKLLTTEGNIQKWELDPILTEELKINIVGDDSSIINVTPVIIDGQKYYEREDVDTRIKEDMVTISTENSNRDIIFTLSESKIIDRIKFTENGEFELFYSSEDGQEYLKIIPEKDENNNTYKFAPVMLKKLYIKSKNSLSMTFFQNTNIYIFNYLSFEIDQLFTDKTFTKLKDIVTYNILKAVDIKVKVTEEYIIKMNIAKELLSKKEEGETMVYTADRFEIWQEFHLNEDLSHGYIEIEYEDNYGNKFSKTPISIQENKVIFDPFYAKEITFKIFGAINNELIITGSPIKNDYYSEIDEDTRIDKSTITATSGCGHYAHLVAQRAVDGDESTQFHSNSFSSIGYGDVYFSFSDKKVIDRVNILTRPNSLGRIQNFKILYKESSSDQWMKVIECIMDGVSGNWRNAHFKPVFAKEICVRVTKGNDDHVLIYETEFFKYNRLYDILLECFTDDTRTSLKDIVDLDYLKYLREIINSTEEYKNIYKEIERLYLDSIEANIFSVTNIDRYSILKELEFTSTEEILRADISYTDKTGKRFISREVQILSFEDGKKKIEFPEIYTDNLELLVYGTTEIYGVQAIIEEDNNYLLKEDINPNYDSEQVGLDYYAIDGVIYTMVKLKEPKVISKILTTFTDEFAVFLENPLTKERYQYNENNQNSTTLHPMIVNDLHIRTKNRRIRINEISFIIHNLLEEEIDNLFTDKTYTELKADITFDDILNLEERVLITKEYQDKIEIAKDLYRNNKYEGITEYLCQDLTIINKIKISLKGNLNKFYGLKIVYIDSLGKHKELREVETRIENSDIVLTFDPIYTKEFKVVTYIEELERWKIHYLDIIPCEQEAYYVVDDTFTLIPQNIITGISRCGSHKPIENALDGDLGTNFYSTSIGDIEFIFEEPKVVDQFRYVCKSVNGNIKGGEIYYKTSSESEWEFATTFSITNSANSNIKILEIPPVLAKEIMIRTLESSSNSVSLYDVNFKIYNSIYDKVNAVFNDDFFNIKSGMGIVDIENLERCIKNDRELIITLELAKVLISNDGKNPFKVFSLKPLEYERSYYFNEIKANSTGNLFPTPHYLKPNQDYILVFNEPINATLTSYIPKPHPNINFSFKRGINIINPGEHQGQLFLQGSRKKEIKLYSLSDLDNALIYRYGYDSYKEFYKKPRIISEMPTNHTCDMLYIEGVNVLAGTDRNWFETNIKPKEFLSRLRVRDEYVDFLYGLVAANKKFDEPIPYKRIMWSGSNSDNPHAGTGTSNGYTAYSGNHLALNQPTMERYAHHWVVGHEIGHELDNNGYLMGIFGEVFNNWFSESGKLEYQHGGGWSNDNIITNEEISIYAADYWGKLAFWFKMRYFYDDREFIIKMNEYMQNNPTTSNEDAASKLAMFTSDILNRDTSTYFLRHSFPISEEAIDFCQTYPPFGKPIWEINWQNRKEFIKEEREIFLQNFNKK